MTELTAPNVVAEPSRSDRRRKLLQSLLRRGLVRDDLHRGEGGDWRGPLLSLYMLLKGAEDGLELLAQTRQLVVVA